MSKQKKFILQESELPTQWYNIQADMPNKPKPPIHPATKQPLSVDDLAHIFPRECCVQELDTEHRWIDIPEEVLDKYKYYRSTPLVRAYALEEALGTPAHIYFKNESTNPLGSHKINSALPQCYYAKQEGTTNVTTETGAGQWGAALSYAAKIYGLDCAVYQVKITMQQKPYRSSIMRTFGAVVEGSPSMSTRAGKDILTKDPTHSGSLGTAISEAVELATTTPNCKYVLGSVLNHVGLHQTIIGLEAEKQMEMAGEYPDTVIACFGGGSNFGGIAFPFMRHNLLDGKKTEFIAAGLRYHGAGMIVSQLIKDGLMRGVDIPQLETFDAGLLFAQTEGIIPAPESCHAIAATIREAKKCKETGEQKVILFNLSGHGLIDMPSYESFIKGDLQNYSITDQEISDNVAQLDQVG